MCVDQDCLWTFGGLPVVSGISWRMGLLEEQDGAVMGLFLPLPDSSPLSILMHTSDHTPAAGVISGWLSFMSTHLVSVAS